MISEFLGKQNLSPEHPLHPDIIEQRKLWEPLKKASFFLGYKDIEAAVARVMRQTSSKQSAEELERELRDWGRTTTLRLYNGAFDETDDYDAIKREFFPLVEMAAREGMLLEGGLKLDNKPLFTADKKTRRPAVFASDIELQEEASNFVKGRGPE
ncbi:hypothetical protein [Mesorhizobium sp. M0802]|uniref:hypothetical protein n=1 Tax=Mesorhizobium sp. M0802 TaxID=2957001 RepID=UPI00333DD52A